MDNIGLVKGKVELYPYDSNYEKIYLLEKSNLERLMAGQYIRIEHVGSTAIKNIKSKPIIDIMVTCNNIEDFKTFAREHIKSDIYTLKEENNNPGDFLIRKEEDGKVKAFIHVTEENSEFANNYILFRDYLNNNIKEAKKYEDLKVELFEKYKDNRKKYTEGKNEYINKIIQKAKRI